MMYFMRSYGQFLIDWHLLLNDLNDSVWIGHILTFDSLNTSILILGLSGTIHLTSTIPIPCIQTPHSSSPSYKSHSPHIISTNNSLPTLSTRTPLSILL